MVQVLAWALTLKYRLFRDNFALFLVVYKEETDLANVTVRQLLVRLVLIERPTVDFV